MAIHNLTVIGYRSIRRLRLPLRPVNVLTGPNGCGKSNLYNAVFLLAKAAEGGFARAIAEEGGMPSVLWAGPRRRLSKKEPVRVILAVTTDQFSHHLECGLPAPGGSRDFASDPEVKEEYVWHGPERTRSTTLLDRHDATTWIRDAEGRMVAYPLQLLLSESVLSQIREPHLYPELSALRFEMRQWRFYHHFRTDPGSPLRQPQIGVRTPVLAHDGSDLAAALATIREIGDTAALDDAVQRAFPGASLVIEAAAAQFRIGLHMPGILRPLQTAELSDGTLRYLCLVAALLSPRPPALLAFNEPETSIHPDLLDPLARLIAAAARSSQLWVTTHSARLAGLIAEHSGEAPIRLEMVDGETRVAFSGES